MLAANTRNAVSPAFIYRESLLCFIKPRLYGSCPSLLFVSCALNPRHTADKIDGLIDTETGAVE